MPLLRLKLVFVSGRQLKIIVQDQWLIAATM